LAGVQIEQPSSKGASALRKANVAVVLSASDRDHFAVSGARSFCVAAPDWIEPFFLTDHDLPRTLGELLEDGEVDAVVFASNSLNSAASQEAIKRPDFVERWAEGGAAGDVGVVVLHQYLMPKAELALDFLGTARFSLVGEQPHKVDRASIVPDDNWAFATDATAVERSDYFGALSTGYGVKKDCVWARFEPRYPTEWEKVAAEGDRILIAAWTGTRTVIACPVPVDLTGATELLHSMLAACLRPRGCLVVEANETTGSSAFTPAFASALDRHRFVHREHPGAPDEIDLDKPPYRFFAELIVAREWPLDRIPPLSHDSLLRKLEQGGSIVATFSGPGGEPVGVRLSGRPQYAERAHHVADWLCRALPGFRKDVWAMRALAEVVLATEAAYREPKLIPRALRRGYVKDQLAAPLRSRVSRHNVDGNPLATLATYAALEVIDPGRNAGLRDWAVERLDKERPSVIAHALVLVPSLRTEERKEVLRQALAANPGGDDDPQLLQAYAAVVLADDDPELVKEAARNPFPGVGVQAELLRCVARCEVRVTDDILRMAAHVRDRVTELTDSGGALEAVCMGNAALIELARKQGLAPGVPIRESSREAEIVAVEETETARLGERYHQQAERFFRIGRVVSTVVIMVLIVLLLAVSVTIFVVTDGDLAARFGFATAVWAFGLPGIAFLANQAKNHEIAPWPYSASENRR
jgi:hypothetical protein